MRHLQKLTLPWLFSIFGMQAYCRFYRSARLVEEALELAQSIGLSRESAHELVDYVYSRPVGEVEQEVGGVALTLMALCEREGIDFEQATQKEFARALGMSNEERDRMREKKRPEARAA